MEGKIILNASVVWGSAVDLNLFEIAVQPSAKYPNHKKLQLLINCVTNSIMMKSCRATEMSEVHILFSR